MQIICPGHAKERIESRGIRKVQIERALRQPDLILPTLNKRRKRVMKNLGSRTLDVIYEPRSKNKIVLVTAVWLEEEDRKVKG